MKRKQLAKTDHIDNAFDIITMKKKKKVCRTILEKVISGGQSGADRAALEAAKALNIQTGGIAPLDFMTSDGKRPELGCKYHLKELDHQSFTGKSMANMYIERSKLNVDHSDGTIAFRLYQSNGTDKTIGYCLTKKWVVVNSSKKYIQEKKTYYKPILIIDDLRNESNKYEIMRFINEYRIKTLNVCGHRNFSNPDKSQDGDFFHQVKSILMDAFELNI